MKKQFLFLSLLLLGLVPALRAQYYPAGFENSRLWVWFDAADSSSVGLQFSNSGLTGTGTVGANTIVATSATALGVGERMILTGTNTIYTITALTGTTATVTPNLAATYSSAVINLEYANSMTDKTGNGRNAVILNGATPRYSRTAFNGRPALSMVYGQGLYFGNFLGFYSGPQAYVVVSKTNADAGREGGFPFTYGGVGAYGWGVYIDAGNNVLNWERNNGAGNLDVTVGAGSGTLANVVYAQSDASGNVLAGMNGTLSPSTASAAVPFPWNLGGVIGGYNRYSGYGYNYQGLVPEVMMLTADQNVSRRQLLEGYTAWKWGMQATLPTAHPYYAAGVAGTFYKHLLGINRISATDSVAGTQSSNGLAFFDGGFLQDNGDYLTATDNDSSGLVYAIGGATRVNRVWYIKKTDVGTQGGTVSVEFDYATFINGMASTTLTDHQLVYNSTDGALATRTVVAAAATSVSGQKVRFALNATALATGYYSLVTPRAKLSWVGGTSSLWTLPANWAGGFAPATTDTVYVTYGFANQPALTGSTTVGYMYNTSNANINLNGQTLTISKGIKGINGSNASFTGSATSGIVYSGTTAATFNMDQATPGTSNSLGSLNVTGSQLSMASDLVMKGALTLNGGKLQVGPHTLTIESTGSLVNTVANSLGGGYGSSLIMKNTVPQTISMDQASDQYTNRWGNLTINSAGVTQLMGSRMWTDNITFTAGKLKLNGYLTTVSTLTNTVAGGFVGGTSGDYIYLTPIDNNMVLSMDQTTPGTTNLLQNLYHQTYLVTMDNDLIVGDAGNVGIFTFSNGMLILNGHTLTLNCATGGNPNLRGSATSSFVLKNTTGFPNLYFDQTTPGTTNLLNNFTLNTAGATTLNTSLIVGGTTTFTAAGKLVLNGQTLTLNGAIANTTAGAVTGSATGSLVLGGSTAQALSMDQTSTTTSSLANLTINNTGGATIAGNATVGTALALTNGILTVPASTTLTLGGTVTGTGGSITATATGATVAFANTSAITLPAAPFTSNSVANLTMNGAGGVTLGGNITVANALTLASGILVAPAGIIITLGGTVSGTGGSITATGLNSMVTFTNTVPLNLPSPTFTTGVNLNKLTVNGAGGVSLGADLRVNGLINLVAGTLSLNGKVFTIGGGSLFTRTSGNMDASGSSTVVFNNGPLITLPTSLFVGNSVANLTMNGTGGVTLGNNLTVGTELALTSGMLTVPASTTLTLGGTVTGTGGTIDASTNASATVAFANTAAITLPAAPFTGNNIANLTMNGAGGVSLGGNVNITNAVTFAGGKLAINGNTLTLNGGIANTVAGGITGSATSSLVVNGSTPKALYMDQANVGTTNSLLNLTFNNTNTTTLGNAFSMATGGTTTLAASGTVSNGSFLTFAGGANIVRNGGGTFDAVPTFSGPVNVGYASSIIFPTAMGYELPTGTTLLNNLTLNNSNALILNAAATVNGLLSMTGTYQGVLDLNGYNLTIGGTFTNTGAGTITATNTASVVRFANTASIALPAATFTGNSLANLTMNGAGGVVLGGNVTVSAALVLTAGNLSLSSNKTLTVSGTIARSSGTVQAGVAHLTFNSPSAITMPAGCVLGGVASLHISGGNVTLGSNQAVSHLYLTGANFIVPSGISLTLGDITSRTTGSIDATNANATVGFTGGTVTTLPTGTFTGSVGNLAMNGAGGITLSENISVATSATFTNGIINAPGTSSLLEFAAGATVSGTSNASHVNGYVRKLGTGSAFTYPVGDATNYQPIGATLSANSGGMVAYYKVGKPVNGPMALRGTLTNINDKEYWDLTPVGTATGTVTIYWDGYNNAGINSAADVANLVVAHYNPVANGWENFTTSTTSTDPFAAGSVTSGSRNTWSPFTLGSTNAATVLPVTLVSFAATASGCTANLAWQTATELNSSYFGVEHSTDAIHFSQVAQVPSSNSPMGGSYHYGYALASGTDYFRLKAVDLDGRFSYSGTVAITGTGACATGIQITVSPNPASNLVNIQHLDGGRNRIALFDMHGKKMTEVLTSNTSESINIGMYANGVYMLRIQNAAGSTSNIKVVKQ